MTDVAPSTIVAGNPARRISYVDSSKSPVPVNPSSLRSHED